MILEYKKIKIYYEITNKQAKGTPILFLHGWEGSTLSFSFFANSINRKCILVDFPPFGKSSSPQTPLYVKDYKEMVCALLKYLRIKKVFIVAHSFGGRVAIEISATTKIVKRMILTGSAGLKKKSLKKIIKQLTYKFQKFLSKINLYPILKLQKKGSSDYQKLTPQMKKTFINIVNYDQKKILNSILAPTLLVWGNLDKETPFYFTKIFKKHIKDCEVVVFNGHGHFAYIEKPQIFLKIITNFFEVD